MAPPKHGLEVPSGAYKKTGVANRFATLVNSSSTASDDTDGGGGGAPLNPVGRGVSLLDHPDPELEEEHDGGATLRAGANGSSKSAQKQPATADDSSSDDSDDSDATADGASNVNAKHYTTQTPQTIRRIINQAKPGKATASATGSPMKGGPSNGEGQNGSNSGMMAQGFQQAGAPVVAPGTMMGMLQQQPTGHGGSGNIPYAPYPAVPYGYFHAPFPQHANSSSTPMSPESDASGTAVNPGNPVDMAYPQYQAGMPFAPPYVWPGGYAVPPGAYAQAHTPHGTQGQAVPQTPGQAQAQIQANPQLPGQNEQQQGFQPVVNLPHSQSIGSNLGVYPSTPYIVPQSEPRNFAPSQDSQQLQTPPPFPYSKKGNSFAGGGNNKTLAPANNTSDPFAATPKKQQSGSAVASGQSSAAVGSSQALAVVQEEELQYEEEYEDGFEGAEGGLTQQVVPVIGPYRPITPPGPAHPELKAMRSEQLNRLVGGPTGLPTLDEARHESFFPFIDSCTQAGLASSHQHGIVKMQNIPYSAKHSEIIAVLGRNCKILNDTQEPIHVIMERVAGKTQDAYIEFVSMQEAVKAVERHANSQRDYGPGGDTGGPNRGRHNHRHSRLGDRVVVITLSSPAQMMKDLFPLARGVDWINNKPIIKAPIEGQPWNTFKGFVTEEEMNMLVKHVEIPQRAQYLKDCPQRPFECMISTIKKLPWQESAYITIRQRHAVWDACLRLIKLLQMTIARNEERNLAHNSPNDPRNNLNNQLLRRLVTAAMLCPGFSVLQKDGIAFTAGLTEDQQREFNQPRMPDLWTHQLTLCPRPGGAIDVLEWYIAIIREETERFVNRMPISERSVIEAKQRECAHQAGNIMYNNKEAIRGYFGYLWREIAFPQGPAYDNLSLKACAEMEMRAIEGVLTRALTGIAHAQGPAQHHHSTSGPLVVSGAGVSPNYVGHGHAGYAHQYHQQASAHASTSGGGGHSRRQPRAGGRGGGRH